MAVRPCVNALREGDLAYEAYAVATRAIVTYCDAPDLTCVREASEAAQGGTL